MNTMKELLPKKSLFQRSIVYWATELATRPDWSLPELIQGIHEASEGTDIDLLVPCLKLCNMYEDLGPEGHRICYTWAAEALELLDQVLHEDPRSEVSVLVYLQQNRPSPHEYFLAHME